MKRKPGALVGIEGAILEALADGSAYAYALVERLGRSRSTLGYALRRLEAMGLVRSRVDVTHLPARRVFTMTAAGRRARKSGRI